MQQSGAPAGHPEQDGLIHGSRYALLLTRRPFVAGVSLGANLTTCLDASLQGPQTNQLPLALPTTAS
jgi:hypothetical protein